MQHRQKEKVPQEGDTRQGRSWFTAPPDLLQKSHLFHIPQLPSLPAPPHRHLRLTNSILLLLPLPLAPLVSGLESPPHPAFLHLRRLCPHLPPLPDSKHTRPTSHLGSAEEFPPAPALIGCFLPTSSSQTLPAKPPGDTSTSCL